MSGGLNSDHIAYLSPTGDLPSHLKILYQGDSITDAGRNWEDATDLGNGYARMVSEQLEDIYGQDIDFDFVNYAHYGWRLMDNWNEGGVNHYQEQFYQFKADIATIFIGFNDIMAGKSEGQEKYVSDKTFEDAYLKLELAESYAQVVLNTQILGGAKLLTEDETNAILGLRK